MGSDTPISYVSLFLSLLGIGLFVLSGYQRSSHHDHHQFGRHEDVFVFDESSNITRLSRAGGHVCVGFSREECEGGQPGSAFRVSGGIQLGGPAGPLLSTSVDGRLLDITGADGTRVRVRLDTGGVLVGQGLPSDIPERGVRVTGSPVPASSEDYDTEKWAALSGFTLASYNGKPYAQIHEVVHESGLRATRLALDGPSVDAAQALHITRQGIVIGDATWEFIDHATRTSKVIATGEVYYETEHDRVSRSAGCAHPPIGALDLPEELLEVEVDSCLGAVLLAARTIPRGVGGFQGCQDNRAFFESRGPFDCGNCINEDGRTYIYFCKTI